MAARGFRMITLASESQALRRGAAEHLKEAAGEDDSGGEHADDERVQLTVTAE